MNLASAIVVLILMQSRVNRQTSVAGAENSWSGSTYNNLNQVTEQVSRNGSAIAVLLSKNVTDYDNRGRVYRTTTWAVNPSTGALGNSLVSNSKRPVKSMLRLWLPSGDFREVDHGEAVFGGAVGGVG